MTDRGDHPHTYEFDDVHAVEKTAIETRRKASKRTYRDDDHVGLALSGGGIRSASVCLGVLQALDSQKCLSQIDYLSSVSGGGYIGCCLTACLNKHEGKPFFNEDLGYGDTPAIKHVRDFSNYLIPRGFGDVVTAVGLLGRGLMANAILVAPLFIASVLLLLLNRPSVESLRTYGPVQPLVDWLHANHIPFLPGFPFLSGFLVLAVLFLVGWAIVKASKSNGTNDPELKGGMVSAWKVLLGLATLAVWLELQPIVLAAIVDAGPVLHTCLPKGDAEGCAVALLGKWFTIATPSLAPLAVVVSFLSRQLGRLVSQRRGLRASSTVRRVSARLLLVAAAIVLPSLLWLAYLEATLALMPASAATFLELAVGLAASLVLFAVVNPNTTSLHRLYRDRLSKAFLFDPDPKVCDKDKDRQPIDPKLHEIETRFCPYPIVNAALNIGGSSFANKRGRNADFFEFTPEYTGSEATGWVGTRNMEKVETKLNLGTAMAISGAAVSPNMGSATIRLLVPTLALLNIRLGFWLANPKHLTARSLLPTGFYLYREILSNLTPDNRTIYLTDGGNIENLGVHALLRRRCKLIIAIDAEADPAFTFGAFLKLQRYARIDFGALLNLPWQQIRDRNKEVGKAAADHKPVPTPGPHIAIGRIRYGPTKEGILVYIKSSLTGDEADYILDYKARNPDFPHETTGDQFFGEEQLEVYRALGFHMMRLFLDGQAEVAIDAQPGENVLTARTRLMGEIRRLLAPPP